MHATTWEIEVHWRPERGADPRAADLAARLADWIGPAKPAVRVGDLFWLRAEESLDRGRIEAAAGAFLSDPVTQRAVVRALDGGTAPTTGTAALVDAPGSAATRVATILKRVGVMDPVEASLRQAARDFGLGDVRARTGTRVFIDSGLPVGRERLVADKVLSNQAIERVHWDDAALPAPFAPPAPYELAIQEVPLAGLDEDALLAVSRDGLLALSLEEMRAVQAHFAALGRAPRDVELETIAQTWSEHCCHKTLTASIEHRRPDGTVTYDNLLKDTIGRATAAYQAADESEGGPFCLSVFRDNAGVVAFDEEYGLTFKVETHNHPSAIEPYGGAGTGIGGVLRDTLGTGLGAKPIVSTDVFCVGPLDLPEERLPTGVLHPRRILRGVVGGVRDYGNRMGIPTASGALYFDERYTTNPLVFCGSVGIIPRDAVDKEVLPGDRVVVIGGATGRDGIHGATFSSIELHEESETQSSGAVQIGNAITEKRVLDVLLAARDRRLFRAVTDCGAGGLSSAVGEMAETTGARVELHGVPLKYEGLSYWEIWISEAQERMVFAVPPEHIEELRALCDAEDVEMTDIGEFTGTGRLELLYGGTVVGDLECDFLHRGRPSTTRVSEYTPPVPLPVDLAGAPEAGRILLDILASPNVASKERVIRQYDHEVQGRSVIKPIQGPGEGPGDGVAFTPRLDSRRGVVLGLGMNPLYGDLDPYRMALAAIDEAVRNVVATGGDPDRTAILDNFSWGNTKRPETLGTIVEAARGCHDGAIALGLPFISGKDSLNNEYRVGGALHSIPPSLLISSMAIADDVTRLVTMDLQASGSVLVLVGTTRDELGGSHLLQVLGRDDPAARDGGAVPGLPPRARELHRALHGAIVAGLVRSCHDLSEGGLAVAAAEMAFAGRIGAELRLADVPREGDLDDLRLLFAESNARYLVEVRTEDVERLIAHFGDLPAAVVGETLDYHILRVIGSNGDVVLARALGDLERAWRGSLVI